MGPPPHAPCTRVRPHHASHTRERAALTRRPSPLGHPRAVPRTPMHHRTHALRPRAGLPHWPSSSTGHPSCAVHTRSLTREPSQRTCAEKSWPLRCNQARGSPPRTRVNAPRSRPGHPHRAIPEPGTSQTHAPPELMHCARALAISPSAILEHGDTCWLTCRAPPEPPRAQYLAHPCIPAPMHYAHAPAFPIGHPRARATPLARMCTAHTRSLTREPSYRTWTNPGPSDVIRPAAPHRAHARTRRAHDPAIPIGPSPSRAPRKPMFPPSSCTALARWLSPLRPSSDNKTKRAHTAESITWGPLLTRHAQA
jgi:hypothetical protein